MRELRVKLKGIFESRGEVTEDISAPGDAILIRRGQPRWLLLKCPCGCGDELPINLDSRAGKAWRIYEGKGNSVTLYPSIWRDTGCGSHFIVWKDEILLFGRPDDDMFTSHVEIDFEGIATRVMDALPDGQWRSYSELADLLGEIPWDVLDACRHLALRGHLSEGAGKERGTFRKR